MIEWNIGYGHMHGAKNSDIEDLKCVLEIHVCRTPSPCYDKVTNIDNSHGTQPFYFPLLVEPKHKVKLLIINQILWL
jgi:hypothetical protein